MDNWITLIRQKTAKCSNTKWCKNPSGYTGYHNWRFGELNNLLSVLELIMLWLLKVLFLCQYSHNFSVWAATPHICEPVDKIYTYKLCAAVWFLVITATNHNGQNRNGHKLKQPHTETATDRNGHKPERPQTEMATNRKATDRNGHKPKWLKTEWTEIIKYTLYRNLKSDCFFGQFCIHFCQLHSCLVVYMYAIMEHCLLFPDRDCWSFDVTFIQLNRLIHHSQKGCFY